MSVAMLKLLLTLTICHLTYGGYPLADFYDYGVQAGDQTASGALVNLGIVLPFFQHRETQLFATVWGVISFQRPISDHTQCGAMDTQSRMIAAYWTHVDLSYGGTFSYRQDTNPKNLNKAAAEIRAAFPQLWGVDVKWLFIATWANVTYFNAIECPQPYPRNTYQAIIATNGVTTFTIFKYHSIVWTTGTASCTLGNNCSGLAGTKGTAAKVGFDAGDGKNLQSAPNSCTDLIANIDDESNTGVPGMLIYRVDSSSDDLFASCDKSGKYNDGKTKLLVTPSFVQFSGGMQIYLQGPCFEKNSSVACVFHDPVLGKKRVAGEVRLLNGNVPTVACVVPFLQDSGRISVDVEAVDATYRNTSFYSAYVTVTYPEPIVNATYIYGNWQQGPLAEFVEFTWYTESFNSTINVSLLYNDPVDRMWKFGATIRENLENNGKFNLSTYQLPVSILRKLATESITTVMFTFESTYSDFASTINGSIRRMRSAQDAPLDWAVDKRILTANIAASNFLASGALLWNWDNPKVKESSPLNWNSPSAYCNEWYQVDPGVPINSLIPCPRTLDQALADPNFERDKCTGWCLAYFHAGATASFRSVAANSVGAGQQCTYNGADGGRLLIGPPGGGTADKVSPNSKLKLETSHFSEDVVPYFACCKWSDNCDKYYERRPSDDGTRYVPPRPGQGTGDPHIATFDMLQYTFNGAGEFWFLKSQDAPAFSMQCRMEPVSSNATVYTAFVMRDGLGPIVQIQLSQSSIVNEILVDSYPLWFNDPTLYTQCFSGVCIKALEANLSRVSVAFDSGFTFIFQTAQGAMTVLTTAPDSKIGRLSGLLGNFDGRPENDLTTPNGTVVAWTSTLFDIHWSFGMNWLVSQNDSLFTYATGKSYSYYYNPQFTPLFNVPSLSSLPAEQAAEVEKVCGKSTDCLFDYFATGGNLAFAEQTAATETQFNQIIETLDKVIVMCSSISSPANGTMITNSSFYDGTQVSFTCKPGYDLVGASSIQCVNGTWSNVPPVCQKESAPGVAGRQAAVSQAVILIAALFCFISSYYGDRFNL